MSNLSQGSDKTNSPAFVRLSLLYYCFSALSVWPAIAVAFSHSPCTFIHCRRHRWRLVRAQSEMWSAMAVYNSFDFPPHSHWHITHTHARTQCFVNLLVFNSMLLHTRTKWADVKMYIKRDADRRLFSSDWYSDGMEQAMGLIPLLPNAFIHNRMRVLPSRAANVCDAIGVCVRIHLLGVICDLWLWILVQNWLELALVESNRILDTENNC